MCRLRQRHKCSRDRRGRQSQVDRDVWRSLALYKQNPNNRRPVSWSCPRDCRRHTAGTSVRAVCLALCATPCSDMQITTTSQNQEDDEDESEDESEDDSEDEADCVGRLLLQGLLCTIAAASCSKTLNLKTSRISRHVFECDLPLAPSWHAWQQGVAP